MTPVFPFYTAIYTAVLDQLVLRLSHRGIIEPVVTGSLRAVVRAR